MSTVGRASIEIGADGSGFSSGLRSQVQPALDNLVRTARSQADSMARSMGNSLANVIPRVQDIGRHLQNIGPQVQRVGDALTRSITLPAVGAATAAAGITAALGWSRLASLDTAKGQLRGLGYEAEDVDRITSQLSKDLEGGMMTLGQATAAAANGMAAGVAEGAELTRYIQLMDSAVVAGTGSLEEMNQIFAQTADMGHLTSNNFDILTHRLPGFSSAMQEHMGVSGQAFRDMLNSGEVSMDDFLDVMDNFAGDMAGEYSKTWEGMVQNTKAWIGVLGENLLGGVFEQSKESLAEFIDFLSSEEVAAWAQDIGESIGEAFTKVIEWVKSAIEWWMGLDSSTQKLIGSIALFVVALGPILSIGGKVLTWVGKLINSKLGVTFTRWATSAASIIGAQGLGGIATIASKVWGIFGRFVRIGGILGVVITAITAVWQHSEGFRDAVGQLWETLKSAFSGLAEQFGEVWNSLSALFEQIFGGEGFGGFVDFILNILAPVFTFLVNVVIGVVENIAGLISGLLTVFQGFVDLVSALFRGDWSAAWEAVKTIVSGAVQAVWNLIQLWIVGRVLKIFKGFGSTLRNLWSNIWGAIRKLVSDVWTRITSIIRGGASGAHGTVTTIFTAVRNFFTTVWNAIRTTISTVINSIRSTISNVFNAVRSIIQGVMNGVRSIISGVWNAIRSIFTGAVNGVRNTVSNGFNGIVNFVRGLPGRLLSALGNIGRLFTGAGSSLINGFRNGIVNAWGRVTSFVRNGLQGLRNLLPFSPAKEGPFSGRGYTLYSGQALIGDFAKGIQDQEADLVRDMRRVAASAQNALEITPYVPSLVLDDALGASAPFMDTWTPRPPRRVTEADRRAAEVREPEYGGGDLIQVVVPRGGDRVAVLQGLESGRFRSRTRGRGR